MLAVYTFVFGVVFQARWNIANNSRVEYALILFSGLIAFNIFAECVNKAPRMVVDNSEYVKKVIYPLEILPIIALGESIFYAAVSLLVWLAAYLALFGLPHLAILTLPIVLAPLCLFILGICWALAALGVYFRDISQFINILTTGLLFLSAIFYSLSSLPKTYQIILRINPLTTFIDQLRNVLFLGKLPDGYILLIQYFLTILVCYFGFVIFQKTRKGFADVL